MGSGSDARGSRIALLGRTGEEGAHGYLDAMNTGHAALTWLSTVGTVGWGRREGLCEPHASGSNPGTRPKPDCSHSNI